MAIELEHNGYSQRISAMVGWNSAFMGLGSGNYSQLLMGMSVGKYTILHNPTTRMYLFILFYELDLKFFD